MQPRTLKNSRLFQLVLLCFLALPLWLASPTSAFAATALDTAAVRACIFAPNDADRGGITVHIVGCLKGMILTATTKAADSVSGYVNGFFNAVIMLSLTIIGIQFMSGRSPPWNEALMTLARISFAAAVIGDVEHYYNIVNNAIDEMIEAVTFFDVSDLGRVSSNCTKSGFSGVSPIWYGVDCAINTLVGSVYGQLSDGMLGFIGASLFSGSAGFFITILGAIMICMMFFLLAQAVFVYISAIVAIALLVIVSPLCIVAIIFNSTRQYFYSWLNIFFTYVLQPIILFAYMSVFMLAMCNVIFTGPNSIFSVVTTNGTSGGSGVSFGSFIVYTKGELGQSVVTLDGKGADAALKAGADSGIDMGYLGKSQQLTAVTGSKKCPTGKGWADCLVGNMALDKNMARDTRSFLKISQPVPMVDWGAMAGSGADDIISYQKDVIISFLSAVITIFVFMQLLKQMPYIGGAITGSGGGIPTFGAGKFSATDNPIVRGLQSTFAGMGAK